MLLLQFYVLGHGVLVISELDRLLCCCMMLVMSLLIWSEYVGL